MASTARRRRIALAETLEHDYIGMHTGSTLQAYLSRITEQMGRTLKLRIQLTSFDAMCRMVSGGVGTRGAGSCVSFLAAQPFNPTSKTISSKQAQRFMTAPRC